MNIEVIEPKIRFITSLEGGEQHIERCGRVCYKSEDRINDDSAEKFVSKICRNHHESVLEHMQATAIIVCSRSASHQLVRHRLGAYSQESQRYVNYAKKGYQIIAPPWLELEPKTYELEMSHEGMVFSSLNPGDFSPDASLFMRTCGEAFYSYERLLENGRPEDARYVLPNACKTELAVTYNMRVWRHVIRERALNKHAQWEIRGIFTRAYDILKFNIPSVFEDLE